MLWKGLGRKGCKSQRSREFAVTLCVLGISDATPMSHHDDCLTINEKAMQSERQEGRVYEEFGGRKGKGGNDVINLKKINVIKV